MSVRRLALTFERCAAASSIAAATPGMSVAAVSSGAERSVPALAELFESGAASAILARRHPKLTPTALGLVAIKPREAATLAPAPVSKSTETETDSLAFPSTASDTSTAASSEDESEDEHDEKAELAESSDSEPECDVEPASDVSALGQLHEPELELERCAMEQNDVDAAAESLAAEGSSVPTALITASTDSRDPTAVKCATPSVVSDFTCASLSTATTIKNIINSNDSTTAPSNRRRQSARPSAASANAIWAPPTADARFMNYADSERYQAARQAGIARRQQLGRQQQQRRAEVLARARASAAQQAATARQRQPLAIRGAAARVFGYEQDARFLAQREANRARIAAIREARAAVAAARFN